MLHLHKTLHLNKPLNTKVLWFHIKYPEIRGQLYLSIKEISSFKTENA